MGKWPWQCTTRGLNNSTELQMEKNPSSGYRGMGSANLAAARPAGRPPTRSLARPPTRTVTIPLQPEGKGWGVKRYWFEGLVIWDVLFMLSLIPIMACRLFGADQPLLEPMMAYCQLNPWGKSQWNLTMSLQNGGYFVQAPMGFSQIATIIKDPCENCACNLYVYMCCIVSFGK